MVFSFFLLSCSCVCSLVALVVICHTGLVAKWDCTGWQQSGWLLWEMPKSCRLLWQWVTRWDEGRTLFWHSGSLCSYWGKLNLAVSLLAYDAALTSAWEGLRITRPQLLTLYNLTSELCLLSRVIKEGWVWKNERRHNSGWLRRDPQLWLLSKLRHGSGSTNVNCLIADWSSQPILLWVIKG